MGIGLHVTLVSGAVLLGACGLFSATPTEEWSIRQHGFGYLADGGLGIAADQSGNVYVAGESSRPQKGGDAAWVFQRKYER